VLPFDLVLPDFLRILLSPWSDQGYWAVRWLLGRGLAFVYLIAFVVAARQFRPLSGEDGILPLSDATDYWSFREKPSLFHRFDSDRAIGVAAWTGVGLSALALLGLPSMLGTLPRMAVWIALWGLYQSFVNLGQDFYGFGWESMLLEAGFLAIFLGGGGMATPAVVVWLFRWLLFRDMFGAGLIKIRGDDCWRDLTAMEYHYETQPMPNPVSWFAHHQPRWTHKAAVLTNHVVELLVPCFYFAPQPFAAIAGLVTIGFQLWLMLTGNFSWLNLLTAVLAFSTFTDAQVRAVLDTVAEGDAAVTIPAGAVMPGWHLVLVVLLAVLVLLLSIRPTVNVLSSDQKMNTGYDPLHLVNSYGAFGSITKERLELVIEGTNDEGGDADWQAYEFYGKPDDPGERPPQVAPYHHRLGWHLWFAAMTSVRRHPWVIHLVAKLLRGDDGTLALIESSPFPADDPPDRVRVVRYRYRFTTPGERSETGDWWERERLGEYYGPVSLDDYQLRHTLRRRGWDE
jgi:hypothetical protein